MIKHVNITKKEGIDYEIKTLLLSTALATSLLGACGNSNHDSDTKR